VSARDQQTPATLLPKRDLAAASHEVPLRCTQCRMWLALQSPNGFDRHQENALSQRRGDEAMSLVEADGFVVDRMHDDRANARDLRGGRTSAQRIGKQIGAKAEPLKAGGDGEPRDQKQRHLVRHALAQLCHRQRRPLLHGSRDRIITDHLTGPVGIADDIGACRSAFAGEGTFSEPVIERGMTPIVERGDLVLGVQAFRWCNTARGHGNQRRVRSPIPERFALHQLVESWQWRRRRIEHGQELLMALGIQKESALIEDRSFSFPPRARKHEFGQLLPAQGGGPAEHRLELRRRPDLNDIVLARRSASVGTGVLCHVAKLLDRIWQFATTMSIQSDSQRHRFSVTALALASLVVVPPPANAQGAPPAALTSKQGYWWYEAPRPKAEDKPETDTLVKPAIPPMAELATWTPPKIRKLIEEQRDYAATVLTVDAVADFWRLQDFARRKARAFAGVTQIAMLQYPELNSKSANPMVGDARSELGAQKDAIRRSYLRAHASEFALVMFSRSTCGYCRVQWPIVQRFQEEMGWQVTLMDVDKRPDVSQRFGVEITPTTMIIRRGSQQRMVIASGVEAYPNLAQLAYQAVRLLRGDIRPEQFMTGPGEENGFFDALSNGPVSASDPRALGGDLIQASSEPRP
jgi:conjugal transfer pilus assembly protein TraF